MRDSCEKENKETGWWSQEAAEVLRVFEVESQSGLSNDEVEKRRNDYGPNVLREVKPRSRLKILWDQVKSPVVLLMGVAAIGAALIGEWVEALAVLAVLVVNATIGYVTEWRATKSMEALRKIGGRHARVRRNGGLSEIPASDLVPGDIVLLEGGDVVTADMRLIEANQLTIDESSLTGESARVTKTSDSIPGEAELHDRECMAYKGTAVGEGSGEAVVVATGTRTELGKISSLVDEAGIGEAPLEIQLHKLGTRLIGVVILLASLSAAAALYRDQDLQITIETSVALAIAAIPEGLPIVATIALARGMKRMSARNALINRLSAVEALGSTSIICTDKTGTITENKMNLQIIAMEGEYITVDDGEDLPEEGLHRRILETAVLCNNADINEDDETGVGDPMEVALLEAGYKRGLERPLLLDELPELREEAFSSKTMMMATFHKEKDGIRVAVKGSPEAVIEASEQIAAESGDRLWDESEKEKWLKRNDELAGKGLRLLAIAEKKAESEDEEPYEGLTFLGLTGMADPPRADVADAIQACRKAGIRVIIVTGDHPATAARIATDIGLIEEGEQARLGSEIVNPEEATKETIETIRKTSVFARVSPEAKLHLVKYFQKDGAIVAMTGDGVNDAPALQTADVGVAMGKRGTQVAQDASDIIIKDDAFATIVRAVEEGRVIGDNIRKSVVYMLSLNFGTILTIFIASLIGSALPLLPLQILYLNMSIDVFPALALGAGPGREGIMNRPPRPAEESILTARRWSAIAIYGAAIAAVTLGAFYYSLIVLEMATEVAVTIAFVTLGVSKCFQVFNMRASNLSIFRNDVVGNRYVWHALVACAVFIAGALYIPGLNDVLGNVSIDTTGWTIIGIAGVATVGIGAAVHAVLKMFRLSLD